MIFSLNVFFGTFGAALETAPERLTVSTSSQPVVFPCPSPFVIFRRPPRHPASVVSGPLSFRIFPSPPPSPWKGSTSCYIFDFADRLEPGNWIRYCANVLHVWFHGCIVHLSYVGIRLTLLFLGLVADPADVRNTVLEVLLMTTSAGLFRAQHTQIPR